MLRTHYHGSDLSWSKEAITRKRQEVNATMTGPKSSGDIERSQSAPRSREYQSGARTAFAPVLIRPRLAEVSGVSRSIAFRPSAPSEGDASSRMSPTPRSVTLSPTPSAQAFFAGAPTLRFTRHVSPTPRRVTVSPTPSAEAHFTLAPTPRLTPYATPLPTGSPMPTEITLTAPPASFISPWAQPASLPPGVQQTHSHSGWAQGDR